MKASKVQFDDAREEKKLPNDFYFGDNNPMKPKAGDKRFERQFDTNLEVDVVAVELDAQEDEED